MKTKICSKCGENKRLELFSKNKNFKDGYNNKCKKCRKLYNIQNKEKIKQYDLKTKFKKKEYYLKNKEKYSLYYKEWFNNNRDEVLRKNREYIKIYYQDNKEKISNYICNYQKEKYKNDSLFKLSCIIRSTIKRGISQNGYYKNNITNEILGCSFEEFKLYLESKFEPWMTWDNQGKYNGELNYGWDIDHIIPISSAKSEEELIKLNHYSNLQPLCSKVNRDIKKDKTDYENIN